MFKLKESTKKDIKEYLLGFGLLAIFILGVYLLYDNNPNLADKIAIVLKTIANAFLGVVFAMAGFVIIFAGIKRTRTSGFHREEMDESKKQSFIENDGVVDELRQAQNPMKELSTKASLIFGIPFLILGGIIVLEEFCHVYGPIIEIPVIKTIVVAVCLVKCVDTFYDAKALRRMNGPKMAKRKDLRNIKGKLVALKKNKKGCYRAYYEYLIDGSFHLHRENVLHKESEKASLAPYTSFDLYYSAIGDMALTDTEIKQGKKSLLVFFIVMVIMVTVLFLPDPLIYYFSAF